MKIGVIGTGYVGLPTAIGFASKGFDIICIDKDETKIDELKRGNLYLFENGLEDLFNKYKENIIFSTSIDLIKDCDFVIIAVGTPTSEDGRSAYLGYLKDVAKDINKINFKKNITIAIKSTVPVGTGDVIENIINNSKVNLISMPEFLREGYALEDFLDPDRIVVGGENVDKILIKTLYKDFNTQILFTDRHSSELIKYASNSFLAIKLHYINEIANLCEKVNANIDDVAKGMGLDSRIGLKFLKAGIGYGGSCFPKDTKALDYLADEKGVKLSLVKNAIQGNEERIINFANMINKYNKIAIFGLAFKENTDDCRESPAIKLINNLNGDVSVYDPKAIDKAKKILGNKVKYGTPYEIVKGVDVLVIATEWNEFKYYDYDKIYSLMNNKLIIDLRNILDKDKLHKFKYIGVGKNV